MRYAICLAAVLRYHKPGMNVKQKVDVELAKESQPIRYAITRSSGLQARVVQITAFALKSYA